MSLRPWLPTLVGFVLAVALGLSRLTRPEVIVGWLDPSAWDPTVLFVMIGAVSSFALGSTVEGTSVEDFLPLVKNTYRVLLSRGLKGCYVYFMDGETRTFVESRMERPYSEHPSERWVAEGEGADE